MACLGNNDSETPHHVCENILGILISTSLFSLIKIITISSHPPANRKRQICRLWTRALTIKRHPMRDLYQTARPLFFSNTGLILLDLLILILIELPTTSL
jgi:hypothetical protein